jgi:hypothetical protein
MMRVIVVLGFVFAFIALTARESWMRTEVPGARCISNLHNIALSVLGYESANGAFPHGSWPNPDLETESRLSWYAQILPQMDHQNEYDALERDQTWDAGQNGMLAQKSISYLRCYSAPPAAPGSPEPAPYVGIAGLGKDAPWIAKSDRRAGIFGYDRQTTVADIKDGAANTMMIAETGNVGGSWLQAGWATVRGLDRTRQPYIGAGRQFGGQHGPSVLVAMADGSVRRIQSSVSPQIFEGIATMAGGEKLPKDWSDAGFFSP